MKRKFIYIFVPILSIAVVVMFAVFLKHNNYLRGIFWANFTTTNHESTVREEVSETTTKEEISLPINEKLDEDGLLTELTVGDSRFVYDIESKTLTVSGKTIDLPVRTDYWKRNAEKIVFCEGVKEIDESFLNYSKVKIVELPSTLEAINHSLFYEMSGLEKYIVSPQNKKFYTDESGNLYETNQLLKIPPMSEQEEYIVSDKIKEISYNAFYGCVNLKKIIIGENFEGDLDGRFRRCPALEAIEVSERNSKYCSDSQGAVYNRFMTEIYGIPSQIEEFIFPASLFNDSYHVGEELSGIKKVYFSKHCEFAREVLYMFNNLEEVFVEEGNRKYSTQDGVLYDRYKTVLYYYPPMKKDELFKVPASVVQIYNLHGKKIKRLEIPDNVKNFDYAAFFGCSALEYVKIGSGLETIDYVGEFVVEYENPFKGCNSLKRIDVDKNNKYFRNDSFGVLYTYDMKNLLSVPAKVNVKEYTVPDSVTIVLDCFTNCSELEVVNFGAYVEGIATGEKDTESLVGFSECLSLREINVSSKNPKYMSIDGVLYDKEFKELEIYPPAKEGKVYSLPKDMIYICNFAFEDNKYLEKVYLHKSVKVNHYSYYACDENGLMFDIYYEGTGEDWLWKPNSNYEVNHKIYYNAEMI